MKHTRIIVTHYGGPDELRVVEEECPDPKHGQVRVRVLAAGVSLPDVMMREGIHPETPSLPFTPGWDLVGVVDRLGEDVYGIELGQIVAALPIYGAYAEFVCLPYGELVPVPSGLDAAEAVSLILNYVTAYQMLHRSAKVTRGQRALIHGAAGGVGSALLELGSIVGLEMYGTCSSRGASTVSDLGGLPIDYQHQDFVKEIHDLTNEGVDIVFDGIGGTHIWRSRRALCRGGKVVAYGLTGSLRGGAIGLRPFRRPTSHSWNRHLRIVHCWWVAVPRSETGGTLQYPVAQTAETDMVSTGLDHSLRPPSTAKDQAADRAAISSYRGKTGSGVAREGRRHRQDRTRAQWVIVWAWSGLTTGWTRARSGFLMRNSSVRRGPRQPGR